MNRRAESNEKRRSTSDRKRDGQTDLNFLRFGFRRSNIEFAVGKSNGDAQTERIRFFVAERHVVIALLHFFDSSLNEIKRWSKRLAPKAADLPYHRGVSSRVLLSEIRLIESFLFESERKKPVTICLSANDRLPLGFYSKATAEEREREEQRVSRTEGDE